MSYLSTVQKELGSQSRDLTGLVQKVKDIMPQYSDDHVCQALMDANEDVDRAVELLLSGAIASKAGKKKKEKKETKADAGHEGTGGASILTSVPKEGGQSPDMSDLVEQVKGILPDQTDDAIYQALVDAEEDVDQAVELLLNGAFTSKSRKKKGKERQAEAGHDQGRGAASSAKSSGHHRAPEPAEDDWGGWGEEPKGRAEKHQEEQHAEEPAQEERPKSEAEKTAAKLKKKLREIKTIEEKLEKGEKVDPLQLPKIQKKSEVEYELLVVERKVREEEAIRQEEAKRLAEERALKEAEERKRKEEELRRKRAEEAERQRQEQAAREEAARQQREEAARRQREEAARQAAQAPMQAGFPPQRPPTGFVQQQQQATGAPGAQILSMLQKGGDAAPTQQEAARQTAAQLSRGGQILEGQGVQSRQGGKGWQQGYQGYNQGEWSQAPAQQAPAQTTPPFRSQPAPQYPAYQQQYQQGYQQGYETMAQPQQASYAQAAPQYQAPAQDTAQRPQQDAQFHQPPDAKSPAMRPFGRRQGDREDWADVPYSDSKGDEIVNQYSTPLDMAKIKPEQKALAERIAKEIEGDGHGGGGEWSEQSRNRSKGGKGERSKGDGKGKGPGKTKGGSGYGWQQGGQEKQRHTPSPNAPSNMSSNRLNW